MLRRLVVSAAALAALVALVPPAGAADPAFFRQSGLDRYGTAAAVSSKAFPAGADNVFVASGTSFPDALAGASFAAANGGPILLVRRDALPNATAEELDRLNPKVVTVLGGTSAVSDPIAEAVAEYASVEARRVSGADRWSTAANISSGFVAPVDTVYVASGLNYPDALAGGAAIGGTTGGPVLLVLRDAIPSATAAELTRLQPTNIVVLGGTAAVSKAVLDALVPYAPNPPLRRSGDDRYETALQVANAFSAAPVVYLAGRRVRRRHGRGRGGRVPQGSDPAGPARLHPLRGRPHHPAPRRDRGHRARRHGRAQRRRPRPHRLPGRSAVEHVR